MTRSTSIHIDDSELRTLELDLRGFDERLQVSAKKTLRGRVGPKLRDEMKDDARGAQRSTPSTIRHLHKGVTFNAIDRGWGVEAGIRPGNGRQGSLAHILAYGTARSAPVYDHTQALARTEDDAARWIADDAADAVWGDDR